LPQLPFTIAMQHHHQNFCVARGVSTGNNAKHPPF